MPERVIKLPVHIIMLHVNVIILHVYIIYLITTSFKHMISRYAYHQILRDC